MVARDRSVTSVVGRAPGSPAAPPRPAGPGPRGRPAPPCTTRR